MMPIRRLGIIWTARRHSLGISVRRNCSFLNLTKFGTLFSKVPIHTIRLTQIPEIPPVGLPHAPFFTNMPANAIDFFVICDNTTCYLFFSNDGGSWFRTSTSKSNFPSGWGGFTTVMKSSNQYTYFEASWVYKLINQEIYFAGIEGIGSDGTRYYQTFTTNSLSGSWTELTSDFASHNNAQYAQKWNNGISHGELIRAGYDELLELNPCGIKFLYQGVSPSANGPYETLPYKLGLLTSTNPVPGC